MVGSRTPFTAKSARRSREQRAEIFDHAELIEHRLGQHEQALLGGNDLRNIGEIAFDDQRAHRAARDLHVGRAMRVWVIPIAPGDMVGRNGDFDIVALARLHDAHDIVGDAGRTDMQSVGMKVGSVEVMRQGMVRRRGIAIGRHVVDELDAQHIAWLYAQSGSGHGAFVHPHIEPVAADILIGVSHAQRGVERAIDGTADLRLDERRSGREVLQVLIVCDRLVIMCRRRTGHRDGARKVGKQPCRPDTHSVPQETAPRQRDPCHLSLPAMSEPSCAKIA